MRSRRSTRRVKHQINIKTLSLLALVLAGLVLITKAPLFPEQKKQYVVKKNGAVEKIPASVEALGSGSSEVKKTVIDQLTKDPTKDTSDVVSGNEFARIGILDYYPGGYHVSYPDGFQISYSPTLFEAQSPVGGKVIVTIINKSHKVEMDLTGASADQKPIIEAASRLISSSFRFITEPGYDAQAAKERFSN